ncbi:MAG: glycosyltransferase [Candidatus Portnoybacteria bacterium]|nr:glycosyltransferase [Candidatus Portnoybacteria bacterium]
MKKIIIFSTAYLPMIGGAELAVKEITDRISDCEFDLICARLRRDLEPAMRFPPLAARKQEKIGRINVYRVGFGSRIDKLLLPLFGFLKARKLYKDCQRCHLERSRAKCDEVKDLVSGNKILHGVYPEQKRRVQNDKNEIKVVIWGLMASWGSAAAWLFKIFYPRVPFLLTLQEGDAEKYIQEGRLGLINIGWRLILRKADYTQVISNYLAEMAKKYGYRGKIEVVPNGVDLNKFQIPDPKFQINRTSSSQTRLKLQISNIKTDLGITVDEKVIITVSRLAKKNGIDDLIEGLNIYCSSEDERSEGESKTVDEKLLDSSVASRNRSMNKTKLLILGSGPLENELKSQVSRFKLQDVVIFLGDIPNDEVPKYLAIADVFVRPSLSEGLGTAFLEAMATRVPVVATSVGGIPDFLRDRETGLFCEVKNPKSIAEKIKTLLENNELRSGIITNARKMVEEKYSWTKIARKMAEIFDKLA